MAGEIKTLVFSDGVSVTDPSPTSIQTTLLSLTEQASTPSTPSAGSKKLYVKNDGKVYTLDSAGNEVEIPDATSALSNPMTTEGDLIVGGASGVAGRLAVGTADQILKSDGTTVSWSDGLADASTPGLVSTTSQTFAGTKKFQDGYLGNIPTVLYGTITLPSSNTNESPTSYTTNLSDSNYFVSQSVSSGTLTVTLGRVGYYRVLMSMWIISSGTATASFLRADWNVSNTSTATLIHPSLSASNLNITSAASNSEQQDLSTNFESIWQVTAAGGQTLVMKPIGHQTFTSGTHTLYVAIAIYPI